MRRLEWVFLVLGLVLLVSLLYRVGLETILDQFRDLGWFFVLVLLISGLRHLARTLAWRRVLPKQQPAISLWEMFQVRIAGETLNYLSFAGPLLGEPAKATLLRDRLPISKALGGTVLEAGSYAVVSGLVIVIGLPLGLLRVTLEEPLTRAAWLVAGGLAVFLFLLWRALRRQRPVVSTVLRWLESGPPGGWVSRRRQRVEELESQLFKFYAEHTANFRLMFLWDCIGQGFSLLEIYVILVRLGLPATVADVFIVEAMSKVISTLFFFVPARVGTDEGGQGVVFKLLGFGFAWGVGLALVQRLRALSWSAVGVLILARRSVKRSA